jgi:hypothetical protein
LIHYKLSLRYWYTLKLAVIDFGVEPAAFQQIIMRALEF